MRAFRLSVTACLLLGMMLVSSVMGSHASQPQSTTIRWDIASLPGGNPPIMPGGVAYARAEDGSTIKLTGSGTFDLETSFLVSGGGTWEIYDADSNLTTQGTYQAERFVSFEPAPGNLPVPANMDKIGNPADARAGLAILQIKYNDGSRGILPRTGSHGARVAERR